MTSPTEKPRVIPPPQALRVLGPLVVIEGECAYFKDGRKSTTAFALPAALNGEAYQSAMHHGMRRSGALAYRPLCSGCRACQPFRVDTARFVLSRSQKRVQKRCDSLFSLTIGAPQLDAERLRLYARYQEHQHGADGQSPDAESYARFLCETVTDTREIAWRDSAGRLVAVGIIDVVPDGISTVYFFWEPALVDLSLGVYSALMELDLCKRWGKRYYYLGYLVADAKTMRYKAGFSGGEVWDGNAWLPVPTRDVDDAETRAVLVDAERASMLADARHFRLDDR